MPPIHGSDFSLHENTLVLRHVLRHEGVFFVWEASNLLFLDEYDKLLTENKIGKADIMEQYQERCRKLTNWHFWSTVVGVLLFIPANLAATVCFRVGAYSLYAAFCYGGFDEVEAVARLGAWWFVSYPVVHLVTYLLAWKKKWYVPMLVMVWLDLGFQIVAAVYEWNRENFYGVNMVVPDVIITVGFGVAFFISVMRHRREPKRQ